MQEISFQQEPINVLIHTCLSIIPGMHRADAIYYSNDHNRICGTRYFRNISGIDSKPFDTNPNTGEINFWRQKNNRFTWLNENEIFHEKKSKNTGQLNVFDELENNNLLISLPNQFDHRNDLIILYLSSEKNIFGISKENDLLSTSNKNIIGQLLRNMLIHQYQQIINDRNIFIGFTNNTKNLIFQYQAVISEKEQIQEKYGESLIQFAENYIQHHQNENPDYRISLTDKAYEKIKKYQGESENLKDYIEKAVFFVKNLNPFQYDLCIDAIHLNFNKEPNNKEQTKNEPYTIKPQYIKTIQLLDRFEEAAQKMYSSDCKITGITIGSACNPPISAPAISDAIKKHHHKILFLLEQYPDKWEIIRHNFKPINNLLVKNTLTSNSEIA